VEVERVKGSAYSSMYSELEAQYGVAHGEKQVLVKALVPALHAKDDAAVDRLRVQLRAADARTTFIRDSATRLMEKNYAKADKNDTNYVFLSFVTRYLPVGMVGLLIAIIFLAAMGSTASGLNSLASTTIVDVYKRFVRKEGSERIYLSASRWATVGWGVFCVIIALYARRLGNLIEAVNILGSLFYGTILGIFLVAFYLKRVDGHAVFIAAIIAEVLVVITWLLDFMAFLWLNVVGCLLVVILALMIQAVMPKREMPESDADDTPDEGAEYEAL
jgi:Na+/proline symporter